MTPFELSLTQAAAALRSGELSVPELLASTLQRIEDVDGGIDAWVRLVPAEALGRPAERMQHELRARRELSPLHGIPFGVKDMVDTADLPTEAGSAVLAGRRPGRDAPCVQQARDQGGLMLGKTRTHEFAYGVTTPPVRNPWDTDRTAGGSSGGSAAAVASGACAWAIGTDTLGSVRMPAALCGVVGLKPTKDAIDPAGVIPLSWSLDHVGTITRTTADAGLVLEAIRRPDSPALRPAQPRPRVGVVTADHLGPVEEGVSAVLGTVAEDLAGWLPVAGIGFPGLAGHGGKGFAILAPEAAAWHEPLLRSEAVTSGATPYRPDIHAHLLAGLDTPAVDYIRAVRAGTAVAAEWDRLLSGVDVVMLPATPFTAPLASQELVRWPDGEVETVNAAMCRFTAGANVAGLPALTVPAGLSGGLPVGVQLVGRAHSEPTLLAVGGLIERLVGERADQGDAADRATVPREVVRARR